MLDEACVGIAIPVLVFCRVQFTMTLMWLVSDHYTAVQSIVVSQYHVSYSGVLLRTPSAFPTKQIWTDLQVPALHFPALDDNQFRANKHTGWNNVHHHRQYSSAAFGIRTGLADEMGT